MGIQLVKPTLEYDNDIQAFKNEILLAHDADAFAGCNGLQKYDTTQEWLDSLKRYESKDTCPSGYVPSTTYLGIRESDNKIIGIIDIRHHINHPILGLWGGHIGYSIRPSERRKGYAKELLRLDLMKCKEIGLKEVMITCHSSNLASEKTILANGGVFEKEIDVDGDKIKRYWIKLVK